MANPLLFDGTWLQQGKFEDAEAFYQKVVAGTSGTPSKSVQPSTLKSEIAQARQNITKALNEGPSSEGSSAAAVDDKVIQRIKNLELENNNLKKSSQDLTALVKKLEARVAALETGSSGAPSTAQAPAKPAASKPAKDDSDSDFDPFGSDDEDEEEEYNEATKAALEAYHAKKAKKPALIAKSSLLLDVKPWDDETDMAEMEKLVRQIEMDGLVWGQAKLIPVGYGIKKLQINAVVEDDKVSTDDLEDKITANEDFVQSMDIAAFNKI